jgi:GNAT superfamily N-acetyltransferase
MGLHGVEVREIEVGSKLHRSEQDLRDEVLRKPLGRAPSATDLERDRLGRHFIALMHGEVVGCVGVYPEGERVVRLRQMAVSPKLQGLGSALLRHVEDEARANDISRIELHARVSARRFYERNGYQIEGDVFEEITIPHVKMWKRLGEH